MHNTHGFNDMIMFSQRWFKQMKLKSSTPTLEFSYHFISIVVYMKVNVMFLLWSLINTFFEGPNNNDEINQD